MRKPLEVASLVRPDASRTRTCQRYSSPSISGIEPSVMLFTRPTSAKNDSGLPALLQPETKPHTATEYDTAGATGDAKPHHIAPTARCCP